MKRTTKRKALVLSMAMALGMLSPTTTTAQSDGFFRLLVNGVVLESAWRVPTGYTGQVLTAMLRALTTHN